MDRRAEDCSPLMAGIVTLFGSPNEESNFPVGTIPNTHCSRMGPINVDEMEM